MCDNAPPSLDYNTWPSDCKDMPQGFACKGTCEKGFNGSPTAVCQGKKGGWAANGGCKPAKCDAADLPKVANATWAKCDKAEVGEWYWVQFQDYRPTLNACCAYLHPAAVPIQQQQQRCLCLLHNVNTTTPLAQPLQQICSPPCRTNAIYEWPQQSLK